MNYKEIILKAMKEGSEESFLKTLDELPEGLIKGNKVKVGDAEIAYTYSEKAQEVLKWLHGVEIEKEIESLIQRQL